MLRTRRTSLVGLLALVLLVATLGATPAVAQKPEPGPETQPGAEADLSLDLSLTDESPLVGDTVALEVEVANSGPEDARAKCGSTDPCPTLSW